MKTGSHSLKHPIKPAVDLANQKEPPNTGTAIPWLPPRKTLTALREAAASCQGCPLYARATQTVFGEGASARIMFVGEQPGDQEDVAGKPFVGPAGKILDRALAELQIDRKQTYVTNAVKHFKWEARGKRRLHSKPNMREIDACHPWLEAELAAVKPQVLVCLGATAAQAIFGSKVKIMSERGKFIASPYAPNVLVTVHPSSILRIHDELERDKAFQQFTEDLRLIKQVLRQ